MRAPPHLERQPRRGVTVLELMIALVVTGLALVAARLLIETIDDSGKSLSAYARETDRAANGARVLRTLLRRTEVSPDSMRRFRGDPQSASFDTWCEQPAGWIARCRVGLAIGVGADSSTIAAFLPTGEVLQLLRVAGAASFAYVTRDTAGIRRLASWGHGITAPYAVVIESQRDTIVLVIGDRG